MKREQRERSTTRASGRGEEMRWDIAIGVAVGIIVGELVVRVLILLTGLGGWWGYAPLG